MSDDALPKSEIILYQTEDGRTRVQCRFENETIWLTQAQIAELFETTPQNVTLHLKAIFAEGELVEAATCKDYLQVRSEGGREVSRKLRQYRLDAILAVGFRVRSHRGTQFRQWAIGRLNEYLVKGFTMDDERLKNPPGKGQKDYRMASGLSKSHFRTCLAPFRMARDEARIDQRSGLGPRGGVRNGCPRRLKSALPRPRRCVASSRLSHSSPQARILDSEPVASPVPCAAGWRGWGSTTRA